MDKEKQAFEKSSFKRLLDLGNKENQKTLADYYIVSEGRINNFVDCLEKGRAEIAALKAEIERKDEVLQYIVDVINNRQKDSWLNQDLPEYLADYICNRAEQALHIKGEWNENSTQH